MIFATQIHYILVAIIEFTFSCVSGLIYILNPISKPIIDTFLSINGIEVGGEGPMDIKVKDNRFYGTTIARGTTGLFDAYIAGYFEFNDINEFWLRLIKNKPYVFHVERFHPYRVLLYLNHRFFDVLTPECIRNEANPHYEDHADEIRETFANTNQYSAMLMYDLEAAKAASINEIDKMMEEGTYLARENIAKKLKLEPGMKVLDIGCGFGGLAKHLAEKYKVEVTGVTICNAMAQNARKICKGLPVNIIYSDYRAVTGKFDRVVSIEMFEHVGGHHYREYFTKVHNLLNEDGIFVLQSHSFHDSLCVSYSPVYEKSLQTYGYLAQLDEVVSESKGLLVIEDVQNLAHCAGVMCTAAMRRMVLNKDHHIRSVGEDKYRGGLIYGAIFMAMTLTGKDRVYQFVFSKRGMPYVL